jgi:hypothetical protein
LRAADSQPEARREPSEESMTRLLDTVRDADASTVRESVSIAVDVNNVDVNDVSFS